MSMVWIILGGILVILVIGLIFATMGLSEVKKLVIKDVDLTKVPDGVYTGKFQKSRWTQEVEVTVEDHQIVSIRKTDKTPAGREEKIINETIDSIIAKQSPDVDVVSGATADTKAFSKAVENALAQGEGQEVTP